MGKYEQLMQKHNEFIEKGMRQRDTNLRRFYYNIAQGYKMRAHSLRCDQAATSIQSNGGRM